MTGIVVQRYHQLKPSRIQLGIVLFTHLAPLPVIYFYVAPAVLKWSAMVGLVIYAAIEYRRLIRQGNIRLRMLPGRVCLELQQGGQSYFYFKYKVYQTRWFAILKLIDTRNNRTLILNSDCFASIESYRRCRYDLRRLERADAA